MKADEQVRVVAETEAGAIYHDESTDEWLLDLGAKGLTLYFDREEFAEFVELVREAINYEWEVRREQRSA